MREHPVISTSSYVQVRKAMVDTAGVETRCPDG